jgi:hypothetical protein
MSQFNVIYDDDTESWSGLPETTTVTNQWTLLVLDNGLRILSFGNRRKAGEDIHILDATGKNLFSWDNSEWGAEPEIVMGAILRAAGGVS